MKTKPQTLNVEEPTGFFLSEILSRALEKPEMFFTANEDGKQTYDVDFYRDIERTYRALLKIREVSGSPDSDFIHEQATKYKPVTLSWCTSYEEEVKELGELIDGMPDDEKSLRASYTELTGKGYRRKKK